MTAVLFDYPKSAAFGRVLPKSKIYEHASPSTAVKNLFVRQVEQITWQFKLAPETVNLKGAPSVPEIQIFSITLKTGELKYDVLQCIDRAIPFPILFELRYEGKTQAVAAFKRPSDADKSKWVVSDYFSSPWLPADVPREPMPMALDLAALYEQLLRRLIPLAPRAGEGLAALVERTNQVGSKQREVDQTQARLNKEKQFNRKVEINAQLRQLKSELEEISRLNAKGAWK